MRARNIKPGFFKNEELAACQPLSRLLFAGLWGMADREGRLEDRPKRIKAEVLPYDDAKVDPLLDELAGKKFITRYGVNGCRYIQINTFTSHQNPHKKERSSTIPAPKEHGINTIQYPKKPNISPADILNPDTVSLKPEKEESPEQKKPVRDPRLPQIDFNWETKEFTDITEEDRQGWAGAYPAVDIDQEIKKAREWLLSNPERKKKRYRRFITQWLARTQEHGGTKGYQPKKPPLPAGPARTEAKGRSEWDAAEAERQEADRRWRELDAYDRQSYLDKAQADLRTKWFGVETVAFLIFGEETAERKHESHSDHS